MVQSDVAKGEERSMQQTNTKSLSKNRPVIDNHIADSKSSSNTPPSPTSLGSRGNRNNWDVYGLKNLQS
jgi:hypothetical protein